jgi:O-antigen/teichoic acid export membrane protein
VTRPAFARRILTTGLARQSIAILVLQAGGIALAYLLQVLLARWMGAAEYGTYSYVFAWASTIALVSGLGLPAAALRFIPAYEAEKRPSLLRGLLRRSTQLTLSLSVAFSMASTVVVSVLHELGVVNQLALLLLGSWSVPVLALLKLQTEFLRARRRLALAYAPILLIRPFLIAGGALVVVLLTDDLTSTHVMGLVLAALTLVIAARSVGVRRAYGDELWGTRPEYRTRYWLRTSLPLFMIASFVFILGQADLLMVGMFLDSTSVGLYRVAARTAAFVTLALIAVNTVTAPLISSVHARKGTRGLQDLVGISVHLIFWPSLGLTVLLLVFGEPVLAFFGPDFTVARPSLQILALGHLVAAATGPVGYLLNLTGFQDSSARILGSSAVSNIILNALLIPTFGMEGAAFATAVTVTGSNIALYILAVKKLGVHASILAVIKDRTDRSKEDEP